MYSNIYLICIYLYRNEYRRCDNIFGHGPISIGLLYAVRFNDNVFERVACCIRFHRWRLKVQVNRKKSNNNITHYDYINKRNNCRIGAQYTVMFWIPNGLFVYFFTMRAI